LSSAGGGAAAAHLAAYLEASAARWPDRVAVVGPDGERLTYRQLHARAAAVAGFLRARGVEPGDRVAFLLPKSNASVAVVFGALLARAVYVPIDWSGPPERNGRIVTDSGAAAVFGNPKPLAALAAHGTALPRTVVVVGGPAEGERIAWDDVLAHAPLDDGGAGRSSDDVAYILFTSGSTGVPKGVTLTHENATSFVAWCTETFRPTEEDRFSSHAPFQFDLSVLDIFLSIKHGATLFLLSEEMGQNPKKLAKLIHEERLTIWYSAPSILGLLAELGGLEAYGKNDLRLVLFAGEVFPVKHLRRLTQLWPHPAYYNLYGPTETNVCTFAHIPLPVPESRTEPYPIGPACAHCDALVLDADGREVARGEEGLLYIAGPSVFRAYWGRPDLTAERFVERDGKRFYNTGDVVREEEALGFVYLGRRDRMVKRRGYRIELDEVERGMHADERVREAAVIAASDDAGVKIVAFLALRPGAKASIIEMKQLAARALPSSMSPDQFIFLDALPRTPTDKVDYQALARQFAARK
jgi:amino acid adenylation domain-containing protein